MSHTQTMSLASLFIVLASLIAASTVHAADITTREIRYQHQGVTLLGYLALPENASEDEPVPGVLVVHEWWGHDDYARSRAERIAREFGYAAFALDMYGEGILTDDPARASELSRPFSTDRTLMRARARAGLQTLAAQPGVDDQRLASIGYCFGGTVSLELARAGEPINAIVAFHANLSAPLPAKPDQVRAMVLVCNGVDDPFVPVEQRNAFISEMQAAEVDFQFVEYANAVHSFTNPAADDRNMNGVAYTEAADRRSWRDAHAWLEEAFR